MKCHSEVSEIVDAVFSRVYKERAKHEGGGESLKKSQLSAQIKTLLRGRLGASILSTCDMSSVFISIKRCCNMNT